jgi:predicted phosphodiesterase
LKKLKDWQICLIKNWESYTNNTYRQIAEFCDAPSDEAVRSFWRRNKALFEKETLNQKWDALVEEMDNYNDRLDGFEAKVTSKPVQIVDTGHPHQGLHLVISDCHIPFQNHKLMNGLYELLSDIGQDVVGFHIIGDFLDLNSLSRHDIYKRTAVPGITLDSEYAAGNEVLDNFDTLLPIDCWKTFLYGNHEDRHNRWMSDVQNSKTPLVAPDVALKLKTRGYEVKTNWSQDFTKVGSHLELIHGTYLNTYCAKKHMDVLRGSVMFGHSHKIQSYIEGEVGSFNIGGMYDIDSPAFNYASRPAKAQWQNGFALVYIDLQGDYYVNQVIANNGKFVYGSKLY